MTSVAAIHLDLEKLPLLQKTNLCQILEQTDSYEELGRLMQFNEFEIAVIQLISIRYSRSLSFYSLLGF